MEQPQQSQSLATLSSAGTALLTDPNKTRALWALASNLCQTGAVPQHYKGKPGETFAGMLTLIGLGADPIAGLSRLYNVHGKTGVEAKLKIAVANGRRAFKGAIRWTVEGKAGSPLGNGLNRVNPGDLRVTAYATAHDGERVDQTVSLADAVALGWTRRSAKSPDTPNARWEVPTMQVRMLQWRSADWLIELYAPQATNGVRSIEELRDIASAEGTEEPREVEAEVVRRDLDELNAAAGLDAPGEPETHAEPPETMAELVAEADASGIFGDDGQRIAF